MAEMGVAPPPTHSDRVRSAMSRFVDARGEVNAAERAAQAAQARMASALDELAIATNVLQELLSRSE